MSAKITPIQIGDIKPGMKIRATSKGTDEAHEFEVHQVHQAHHGPDGWVFSTSGLYFYRTSWTFERTDTPTRPTQPGVYAFKNNPGVYCQLVLTKHGTWFWLDLSGHEQSEILRPVEDIDYHAPDIELLWAHPRYPEVEV